MLGLWLAFIAVLGINLIANMFIMFSDGVTMPIALITVLTYIAMAVIGFVLFGIYIHKIV